MCLDRRPTLMERVLSQLEQINRSNWQIRDALDTISIRQEKAAERNNPQKGPYQATKLTPPGDYVMMEKAQYEEMRKRADDSWPPFKYATVTGLIEALNREVIGYPNYKKVGSPLLSTLKEHGLLTGPAEKVRVGPELTGDYKDML